MGGGGCPAKNANIASMHEKIFKYNCSDKYSTRNVTAFTVCVVFQIFLKYTNTKSTHFVASEVPYLL